MFHGAACMTAILVNNGGQSSSIVQIASYSDCHINWKLAGECATP